jgi:hypothetical protein
VCGQLPRAHTVTSTKQSTVPKPEEIGAATARLCNGVAPGREDRGCRFLRCDSVVATHCYCFCSITS